MKKSKKTKSMFKSISEFESAFFPKLTQEKKSKDDYTEIAAKLAKDSLKSIAR